MARFERMGRFRLMKRHDELRDAARNLEGRDRVEALRHLVNNGREIGDVVVTRYDGAQVAGKLTECDHNTFAVESSFGTFAFDTVVHWDDVLNIEVPCV